MTRNIDYNAAGSVIVDHRYTDVHVNIQLGYLVSKADSANCLQVADKIPHLIGKRLVQTPKHGGQITEALLFGEIEKALQ